MYKFEEKGISELSIQTGTDVNPDDSEDNEKNTDISRTLIIL